MAPVIKAECLGKKYIIRHQSENGFQYIALKDVLTDMVGEATRLFFHPHQSIKKMLARKKNSKENFWALKDVNLQINQGDRIGIIGRNGAGKSTLLKILSRITSPSHGRVKVKGKISSLLEVGTGFHPELTGRENIFLNGSILGMNKSEIRSKFDDIVEFAEIQKFLDTPVKRYSSGMYVRLAFAVAAHLEPDILLVDEVLAVGDMEFQKKCLGKMEKVSTEGRTIVFVSHNMNAVQSLCNRTVVINHGNLVFDGDVGSGIQCYKELVSKNDYRSIKSLKGIQILSTDYVSNGKSKTINPDSLFIAKIDFFTEHKLKNCYWNFVIENSEGKFVVHSRTDIIGHNPNFEIGFHRVSIEIPRISLRAGAYSFWLRLYVASGEFVETIDSEKVLFEIEGPIVGGIVDLPCKWKWEAIS